MKGLTLVIDVRTPETPGWWLAKLAKKREERLPRLQMLARYHEGDPPLPEGAETMRSAYKAFQKSARTNFAELIVGSVLERCAVRAIRTAVAQDADGDSAAWRIWRQNNLDIEFADVLENMLALGDSYMMIGDDLESDDPQAVAITGEDPRQVVTIHDPVRQSEVRAGLKMFHDDDRERDYAYVFVRGERIVERDDAGNVISQRWENARRYVASRPRKTAQARGRLQFQSGVNSTWDWDPEYGGEDGEALNHRYVPIVRFRNRKGVGEFEPHIDILDRINRTLLQKMIIAMYQAFRLRAIRVDDEDAPEIDPDTGQKVDYDDLLTADPGSFLKIPKNAEIWESASTEMTGILSSIKDDLLHLMAVSRTPMSAISDAVNQSAEGATTVKEGQIFKTEDRQNRSGASLALVMMIAFLTIGDEEAIARAKVEDIRIDWYPGERFSLQQKYDAASKAPAGMPLETIYSEVLQFSPETIALAKGQAIAEQLMTPEAPANGTDTAGQQPAGDAPADAPPAEPDAQ